MLMVFVTAAWLCGPQSDVPDVIAQTTKCPVHPTRLTPLVDVTISSSRHVDLHFTDFRFALTSFTNSSWFEITAN